MSTTSQLRTRNTLFKSLIRAARSRRLHEVSISADDLHTVWRQQKGRCALTGLRMVIAPKDCNMLRPSLDRIDPQGGYTVGNVSLVCSRANVMKGNLTTEQFRWMCEVVVRNEGRNSVRNERRRARRGQRTDAQKGGSSCSERRTLDHGDP